MKSAGTVLYIGTLAIGGTCRARMETLISLGWEVVGFDIRPYQLAGGRLQRSLAARMHVGPGVTSLNRDLLERVRSLSRSIDLIWIDKGMWIYPETLAEVKRILGCPVLHYTADAQIDWQRSRYFLASLPQYDFCVTTKEWEVPDYEKYGARRILLTLQGYSDSFKPAVPTAAEQALYGSDLTFIGHRQKHYEKHLKSLAEAGIDFRVWGDAWHKGFPSRSWLQGRTGLGLFGPSYPLALSCAKIGLGLLGKHIPETSTTRTFEIPAVGTFLLAERTDLHRELFREGVEAEFFGSKDELIDKARFYLKNESARQKIAVAGYARVKTSGYSARELLSKLMKDMEW